MAPTFPIRFSAPALLKIELKLESLRIVRNQTEKEQDGRKQAKDSDVLVPFRRGVQGHAQSYSKSSLDFQN